MSFPTPARSSVGHVLVGKTLFIVGGHSGRAHSYPNTSFADAAQVVDLARSTSENLQAYPFPVQGHRLVEHDGSSSTWTDNRAVGLIWCARSVVSWTAPASRSRSA